MDVKKNNRWVSFIKIWAEKNKVSYREAMRSEACKSAYKAPEPERSPSPVRTPSPEPVPVVETKPKKGKKKAEPLPTLDLPVPYLVRSEPYSEPLIPTVIKKERVKRSPKMVPT
jgi:hypothetical protein